MMEEKLINATGTVLLKPASVILKIWATATVDLQSFDILGIMQ